MPTITVMVWNIQNYGQDSARFRGDYVAHSNFVAKVAQMQGADVLAIMELTRGGVNRLGTLRTALNGAYGTNRWRYDWIKGAIKAGTGIPTMGSTFGNIRTSAQLEWEDRANREGYALFWKEDATKFDVTEAPDVGGLANTMSNGTLPNAQPANALSLVLEGRDAGDSDADGQVFEAPPFLPGGGTQWDALNFPANFSPRAFRNGVRRPFFAVIRVNTGEPQRLRLIPIVVYHAPSNANPDAPVAAVNLSSFTRQLYQVQDPNNNWAWLNGGRAIAGGDYNVDGNPAMLPRNRHLAYSAYTNTFGNDGANAAAQVPLRANNRANNTTVALRQGIRGPIIDTNNNADYRRLELDNVFVRGFAATPAPPQGVIFDLPAAVQEIGTFFEELQAYVDIFTEATDGANWVNRGAPYDDPVPVDANGRLIYPDILDPDTFRIDLGAGLMTSPRRAAEFVRLFISDHLPVTFRFTV